jgi:hypothetical protein
MDRQAVRDRAADGIAPRELVVIGAHHGFTYSLPKDGYVRCSQSCKCVQCRRERAARQRAYRARKRADG